MSLAGNCKTLTAVAEDFSTGNFRETFDFLDDHIVWNIVGENCFIGKQAVIDNCLQVENYFNSVTTNFETTNIISEKNKVVIAGTAEFIQDNRQMSFISACDMYEFNSENKIVAITSYCIRHKQ